MCIEKFMLTATYVPQNGHSNIMADIQAHANTAMGTENNSYNILKFGTPYVGHYMYVSISMFKASTKENTTKATHTEQRCKTIDKINE
jgi:hypothetical protein